MGKKILFLSSANLSTNPRILKEIRLAQSLNYTIKFIGYNVGDWSDKMDIQLKQELSGISVKYISATKNPFLPWLISSIVEQLSQVLYRFFSNNCKLSAYASSKRTFLLDQLLQKQMKDEQFDLIIAHTLPTLYSAQKYAARIGCKFVFDVEDYHPGELIDKDEVNERRRRIYLITSLLPFAEYITCASPLIEVNLRNLLSYNKNNLCTINNFFLKNEFKSPSNLLSEKIKLIWFSQNINAGRGLELILSIWNEINQYFELTLIGKIDSDFYEKKIKGNNDIIIKSPFLQKKLHNNLSLYDIGLALEIDDIDQNKGMALSNKLLAYYQAGLYILATDTPAQQNFMNDHFLHGTTVKQNSCAIQNSLMEIYSKKDQIRKLNKQRYKDASLYSWDRESEKIISIWRKLLE